MYLHRTLYTGDINEEQHEEKGIYIDRTDGCTCHYVDHCGDCSPIFYQLLEEGRVSQKRRKCQNNLSGSGIKTDLLPLIRAVGSV